MKTHKWSDLKQKKLGAAKLEEIAQQVEDDVIEMNLRELRENLDKTQVEMAEVAGFSQAELSRTERRDDHLVSTLRRYVEAMGGELEVSARFGDRRITLRG